MTATNARSTVAGTSRTTSSRRRALVRVPLARRAHLRRVNRDRVTRTDDGVDEADADGVAVLLVAERDERAGALHQVGGHLPVIFSSVTCD
jgi:hypothetical protein